MKLKELLLNIDYNKHTKILLLRDSEKRNISYYEDVTKEVLGIINNDYDDYIILNIFMQFNTITICKD